MGAFQICILYMNANLYLWVQTQFKKGGEGEKIEKEGP
jgi:hypothetical protein